MNTRVAEFYYVNRPDGSRMPSTWHVVLATRAEVLGELQEVTRGPLTPEGAEALGYPLSTILAELSVVAVAERDAALAALGDTKDRYRNVEAALEDQSAELAAALEKIEQLDAALRAAEARAAQVEESAHSGR